LSVGHSKLKSSWVMGGLRPLGFVQTTSMYFQMFVAQIDL
jgi:hypothetical protein